MSKPPTEEFAKSVTAVKESTTASNSLLLRRKPAVVSFPDCNKRLPVLALSAKAGPSLLADGGTFPDFNKRLSVLALGTKAGPSLPVTDGANRGTLPDFNKRLSVLALGTKAGPSLLETDGDNAGTLYRFVSTLDAEGLLAVSVAVEALSTGSGLRIRAAFKPSVMESTLSTRSEAGGAESVAIGARGENLCWSPSLEPKEREAKTLLSVDKDASWGRMLLVGRGTTSRGCSALNREGLLDLPFSSFASFGPGVDGLGLGGDPNSVSLPGLVSAKKEEWSKFDFESGDVCISLVWIGDNANPCCISVSLTVLVSSLTGALSGTGLVCVIVSEELPEEVTSRVDSDSKSSLYCDAESSAVIKELCREYFYSKQTSILTYCVDVSIANVLPVSLNFLFRSE